MFKQIRIRHKLVLSYSIVLVVSIFLGSSFIYFFVRDKLAAGLESELNNTTTILNMVKTAAAVSIKNHLRAVAEKNLEIIRYFYDQSQKGALTPAAAQAMAANILLSQTIGDSGYIYCIDSRGNVTVHPQTALINTLYYIAQEAVQNAVKHAQATRIIISLTEEKSRIHLNVTDNGKGMPQHPASGGIGLQIMQYRANIIGAAFNTQ